jgi:hypothetical protein
VSRFTYPLTGCRGLNYFDLTQMQLWCQNDGKYASKLIVSKAMKVTLSNFMKLYFSKVKNRAEYDALVVDIELINIGMGSGETRVIADDARAYGYVPGFESVLFCDQDDQVLAVIADVNAHIPCEFGGLGVNEGFRYHLEHLEELIEKGVIS